MKITMENQVILKRLQEKKPHYNVTKWAKEDEERRKKLERICEYPYQLQAATVQTESNVGAGSADFAQRSRTNYSNKPFFNKRGGTSSSTQPPRQGSSMKQIIKKETLYIGEHDLGNGPYTVEIITSTDK